jgi:AcrR family transcriptional regulator
VTADQPPTTRSARKRRAILGAATTVFLRNGYLGASMDEIAALAKVSKQTVYKHFADKERLFEEIVVNTVNEASDPVHDEVRGIEETQDLEADLRELARRQLAMVMQPKLLQLRRPRSHVLRTGPRTHDRGAHVRIRTTCRTGPAPIGRFTCSRRTLQLADHVDPPEPGHAPRRRPARLRH